MLHISERKERKINLQHALLHTLLPSSFEALSCAEKGFQIALLLCGEWVFGWWLKPMGRDAASEREMGSLWKNPGSRWSVLLCLCVCLHIDWSTPTPNDHTRHNDRPSDRLKLLHSISDLHFSFLANVKHRIPLLSFLPSLLDAGFLSFDCQTVFFFVVMKCG